MRNHLTFALTVCLTACSAWAGDIIVFSSNRAVYPSTSKFHIWRINPDGTGLMQVTTGDVYDQLPVLSPDATKLAFQRLYSIGPDCARVWVKDMITAVETPVSLGVNAGAAAWSPDGMKLVYNENPKTNCGGDGSPSALWTVDYPSGTPALLPSTVAGERHKATWAADNTNIAYELISGGVSIYKHTFLTGVDTDLIPGVAFEVYPNYSPDGTRIVFASGTDIHVAPLSSPLSQTIFPGRFPAWSPDSTQLIFNAAGAYDIWISDADGTDPIELTSGPYLDIEPWWGKTDSTPPVISGLPGAGCTLWPPNHQLVQIAVVSASDNGGSGIAAFNVTATSNEPENGLGDGDTAPDTVVTGSGLGPRTVQARAERSGNGTGRIYTINATATDASGNTATTTATCTVPLSQGT